MMKQRFPILEYDPALEAILEPSKILSPIDIPERCVLCFFQDVIDELRDAGRLQHRHNLVSEIGLNPVYVMDFRGSALTLAHPGVGAPLSAAFLDELIALGCRQFIACGAAGVLDSQLTLGHVVVPEAAVRDEGTSYHYLPPAREVAATPVAVGAIQQALRHHHVNYVVGKTWTTDAIYRETAEKVALRRGEGCLTVEMEAAALFAVAQFRQVTIGQILYGGDDLTGDEWDDRDWDKQFGTREKLFSLAAEACLLL